MTFELTFFGYGIHFVLSKNFSRLGWIGKSKRLHYCIFNYSRFPSNFIGPKWGISLFNYKYRKY